MNFLPLRVQKPQLVGKIREKVSNGLSKGSRINYGKYWSKFVDFCHINGYSAMPASVDAVLDFMLELEGKYAVSTVASILSVISFAHKINLACDPTKNFLVHRVKLGLFGKFQLGSNEQEETKRLPITYDILNGFLWVLDKFTAPYQAVLFKAILALGYWGCLRICELVKTPTTEHAILRENTHILVKNGTLWGLEVILRSSKSSKKPETLFFQIHKNLNCCIAKAMWNYLAIRPNVPGFLFITHSGKLVQSVEVTAVIQEYAAKLGLNPSDYNTHSLRIGRTTDLALQGHGEASIKSIGRWGSNAYMKYVRLQGLDMPV